MKALDAGAMAIRDRSVLENFMISEEILYSV
jgi:hypothetical protein